MNSLVAGDSLGTVGSRHSPGSLARITQPVNLTEPQAFWRPSPRCFLRQSLRTEGLVLHVC
jgi:hypothetical protein